MQRERRYVSPERKLLTKNFIHKQRVGHRRYANYGRQALNIMFKNKQKIIVV